MAGEYRAHAILAFWHFYNLRPPERQQIESCPLILIGDHTAASVYLNVEKPQAFEVYPSPLSHLQWTSQPSCCWLIKLRIPWLGLPCQNSTVAPPGVDVHTHGHARCASVLALYPPATWPPWPVIKPATLNSAAKHRNHLVAVANTQVCLGTKNRICKWHFFQCFNVVLLQSFKYAGTETISIYPRAIFGAKRMETIVKTFTIVET